MASMANLVTDISIVAGWNPRIKTFFEPKITPQPAVKVSLLHLQSLVKKATLLRVIPLLPDGSSPRESPGIRALGIPVVAGRNRTAPQTPVKQRRVSESTLDGVESIASSDIDEYIFNEEEYIGEVTEERGVGRFGKSLESLKGRLISHPTAIKHDLLTPKILPKNQEETLNISENIVDSAISDKPCQNFDLIDIVTFSDLRQRSHRLSSSSLTSEVGISYFRDSNGSFKPAEFSDWQKILGNSNNSWNPSRIRSHKRPRLFSISSVQRDLSPMSEKTLEKIVELSTPIVYMGIGGQDGTAEDSQAALRSSGLAAGNVAAAKDCSLIENDDVIAVEGEIVRQNILDEDDNKNPTKGKLVKKDVSKEDGLENAPIGDGKITMVIEKDTLFICFPNKIRGDAVVIEIMLEISPLYLEGKPYATFILAGLPHCENGAYINFRIEDEDAWKFHTFPAFNTIDTENIEENKLRGILDLAGKSHHIHLDRSVIIRALRCPMVLEILDLKMKVDVITKFSWSLLDERIIAEFEVNLFFLNVEFDEDAKRSVINFFLINGPQRQEELNVDSPGGVPLDFALGDLEFENHEINARRCRLLRVERLTKDVNQPLRIRFNKQLASVTQEIGVPVVRIGGEATIVEESVTITNARLPLEVVFSSNSTSWKESNKQSRENSSKRFIRTGIDMREANPSISISCLQPAVSPTAEAMNRALLRGCGGLIDRINYDIEESESFDDRRIPIVVVKISLELDVPLGIESMGEIIRIHTGSFGFQFAIVNKRLAGKGVLFEDGDELVVLNCGISDSNNNGKLLITTEWFGEQSLKLSGGEVMEFRLPRVMAKVVGRTVFRYSNQQARVLSRTQHPRSNTISGFTKGKAIISGMDTDRNEVFLQIPCENDGKVISGITTKSSKNYPLYNTRATMTPTNFSKSITSSFDSLLGDFEVIKEQEQDQPAQDTNQHLYCWIWWKKETLILVMIIWLLCFNLISQSVRNSALRISLRQTKVMLEEKERAIQKISSDSRSHLQLKQKNGGVPEDLWWSVVGLEDTQEIGRFKVGLLTIGNLNEGSKTCDSTEITSNCENFAAADVGEQMIDEKHLSGENQAKVVESDQEENRPTDWVEEVNGEYQNKVAQLLEENFTEKTQRIVINTLRLFWYLLFGV